MEDLMITNREKMYASRHVFLLGKHNSSVLYNTCNSLANGKPYFVIGIEVGLLGRSYVEYRVDIYKDNLTFLLGVLKNERIASPFASNVFKTIIN